MNKKIKIETINNDDKIENKTIDFLKNHREDLIKNGFEYLLEHHEEHDDLYDFKNNENLHNDFKKSINLHFDWIIAHSSNKYARNARLKDYIKEDIELLYTYCFFYETIIDIEITPPSLYKNLKNYFIHIKSKYCIN